jgi:6-pyruvoyltetrahydropterin/6-carboxytetrahydropterin synthase
MIIRKLYKFENAHVVRNCSTDRCKYSIHGHSYKVEVMLDSKYLDNGQMVYDFGLMKGNIKDIIDSFDHATVFWDQDNGDYIDSIKKHSARWISIPVNPSAEQLSRVLFLLVDKILEKTKMANGEGEVTLKSIRVHETDTGYAECGVRDVYDYIDTMGHIDIDMIEFSEDVMNDWTDRELFNNIKLDSIESEFFNKAVEQQVT